MTHERNPARDSAIFGRSSDVIRLVPAGPVPGRDGTPAVLGCPPCRRPVPRPGACADGSTPLAECVPCDLYFAFDDRETFVPG